MRSVNEAQRAHIVGIYYGFLEAKLLSRLRFVGCYSKE